jgi:hypothetical protein
MFTNPARSGITACSAAFFVAAVLFLFVGVALGLYMAASHDHSLTPIHAHTNLLGWLSCAVMGLFYARTAPLRPRVIWAQFSIYVLGVTSLMIGLVGVLKSVPALLPLIAVGSLATVAGIALFAWGVWVTFADSVFRRPQRTPERTWESG